MEGESTTKNDTLLWSLQEAARQLGGVSTRSVRRMIEAGELPAVRFGRSVRIHRGRLFRLVEERAAPTR